MRQWEIEKEAGKQWHAERPNMINKGAGRGRLPSQEVYTLPMTLNWRADYPHRPPRDHLLLRSASVIINNCHIMKVASSLKRNYYLTKAGRLSYLLITRWITGCKHERWQRTLNAEHAFKQLQILFWKVEIWQIPTLRHILFSTMKACYRSRYIGGKSIIIRSTMGRFMWLNVIRATRVLTSTDCSVIFRSYPRILPPPYGAGSI